MVAPPGGAEIRDRRPATSRQHIASRPAFLESKNMIVLPRRTGVPGVAGTGAPAVRMPPRCSQGPKFFNPKLRQELKERQEVGVDGIRAKL